MVEYFQVARTEFHANRLMLSFDFVSQYEKMNPELAEGNNPNLIPPESAEIAASVMNRILPDMEGLAKQELGVA